MTTPTLDRDTILRATQEWSTEEQLALADALTRRAGAEHVPTQTAEQSTGQEPPRRLRFRDLAGMASVPGQEPPSDEQVEQWLEEHRMEKYGK